ncbi:MAG: nitronate monooxygenase [Thermoleophilaceae bacterium]
MILGGTPGLVHPVVQAPMAGGPSTPELAIAVSEAGGLGFLAAGYRGAGDVRGEIERVRAATDRPFGVNVFVPRVDEVDEHALARFVAGLGPGAGEPLWDDDDWGAKLELLREARVPVLSFTFGCPSAAEVAALRDAGSEVWITVTRVAEARAATAAGADALVVQGVEAGGHQGAWEDGDRVDRLGLLALLRLVAAQTSVPLVAAGGIGDGAGVAAALVAGAGAAQLGTAFMLADEAGTDPALRAALAGDAPTALTRAFSGRTARGIVNGFMREHSGAPVAYPQIHHATAPLRAGARKRGDADGFNLWAGQAYRLARDEPAAAIVARLAADAGAALSRAERTRG